MSGPSIRSSLGLREIINVSGTMTPLGACIAVPEAIAAAAAILPQFVDMGELQKLASAAIADACGAQAGFVTASCSAAITLAVAASMTGADLARIGQLPDTRGMKREVLIQSGHLVNYGAPLSQAITLSGATLTIIGAGAAAAELAASTAAAITPRTACALYVVSHHAQQAGTLALDEFARVCHAAGVPVIVDAASEYDLRRFLAAGADLVLYSAHKFLGGLTAGIVAGDKQLVRAAYLQNHGIGRGMKVGKEGVAATIAALQAWRTRDHAAVRSRETASLELWRRALQGCAGITAEIEADPTGNPLSRLRVTIAPAQAGITAWDLADALARGARPVIVRDHELEQGSFHLDPCNLHPGEDAIVAERLVDELRRAVAEPAAPTPIGQRDGRRLEALLAWPD
ncbi:L-seryl-tRNA(Ser) seleniumtransferase [Duganella sp. CF517]|uniref:aminotransferase class V-fold PLP-dependent enzyme n=1 Tax=Duganella sp. CF517 TaxID=1881038 RepID=UPI0008C792C2|nr:aminotransferase class V-fold PLP-dependent enzyme [Duganella sp. CF517]SEN26792.1 L-seryl-tRNA(Ser) seleniumtransferase [Duganella sp. CF517]